MEKIVEGNIKVYNVKIKKNNKKGKIERKKIVMNMKMDLMKKCYKMEEMKYGIDKYQEINVEEEMERMNKRYGEMLKI